MPNIGMLLPGKQQESKEPTADTYRITVERDDGVACTEDEALSIISMFFIKSMSNKKASRKKPS
jgi:hypothetical protein